jgi:signal transduction histidine kinase
MDVRRGAAPDAVLDLRLFDPGSLRELWQLTNRTHPVDGAAVRAACLLLLIFYVISAALRYVPGQPAAMQWIRAVMLVYVVLGVASGPRFSWRALRAYTVGMAFLLPSTTAALQVLRGNQPADMALTSLSVFAPAIFLQTGADVLLVLALGSAGTSILVMLFCPPGMPTGVAGLVLGGALLSGATTALVLIAFRGRISESTAWWQEACARERALREFVELAAPHLGDRVLAHECAARFHNTFGPGHCAVLLPDPDGGGLRVAAMAGVAATDTTRAVPASPEVLAGLLAAVAGRQPLVCERLSADDLARRFTGLPWLSAGGTLVVLPIVGDESVAGAVVLSSSRPRRVEEEDLLLWRAMANQVGVAAGSARLFARLQQVLRARGEFIDTMSHELRSPLHVILGYVDMLADPRQDRGFVAARMRASALELLQLVENTLAAARLGSGKVRLEPSEFPLAELVAELRENMAVLPAVASGVSVRWEVADDLPVVRLDRLKVKEIMHNLISNALKFTQQGRIVVRVHHADARICIEVEDTGSGIPREAQARIFDMFERVESAAGPRAGVGLGLYIVKSLAQMMGGTVTLSSDPGRGSHFTVSLPTSLASV